MMSILNDLKPADWAIVFATLIGPVVAVQAQKLIEALRERRNQKHWVFNQLMATRKARLSPDHVRALNMVDLAFYGSKYFRLRVSSETEKAVQRKWKEYFDNLSTEVNDNNAAALSMQRDEVFTDLLEAIAKDVGYDFDRVELKRGAYSPVAHGVVEDEGNRLRRSLVDVFEGKRPLPMYVVNLPRPAPSSAPEAVAPTVIGEGSSDTRA
jgi:hypothetical protein